MAIDHFRQVFEIGQRKYPLILPESCHVEKCMITASFPWFQDRKWMMTKPMDLLLDWPLEAPRRPAGFSGLPGVLHRRPPSNFPLFAVELDSSPPKSAVPGSPRTLDWTLGHLELLLPVYFHHVGTNLPLLAALGTCTS